MVWGKFARCLCGATAMLTLAACAGGGDRASAPQAENCHLDIAAQFPATVSKHNEILIPAMIDGKNVNFQIDTGAYHSSLFDYALDRLGVSYVPFSLAGEFDGLGGKGTLGIAHLNSLALAGVPLGALDMDVIVRDKAAQAAEAEHIRKHADGPVGVLGNDFLKDYDLEFDLAEKQLFLVSQDHCRGQVEHWSGILVSTPFRMDEPQKDPKSDMIISGSEDYKIKVPVIVGGTQTIAWLDSGASTNFMSWKIAARFGVTKQTPGVTKRGNDFGIDGHPVITYRYMFPTFVIGDETLINVPVVIGEAPRGSHTSMSDVFLLGMDFLQSNRVYIAYRERMIYFTPYAFKYADGTAGK